MKFYIYFLVIGILSYFSLCTKANSKSSVSTQFEMTFSSTNSVPQSTKVMENIFSAKSVPVKARILGENGLNEKSLLFSAGDLKLLNNEEPQLELRFKQSDMKNFETPEIRKVQNNIKQNIPQNQINFLQFNENNYQKLEDSLLNTFKETIDKYIFPKETEIVIISHINNVSPKHNQ